MQVFVGLKFLLSCGIQPWKVTSKKQQPDEKRLTSEQVIGDSEGRALPQSELEIRASLDPLSCLIRQDHEGKSQACSDSRSRRHKRACCTWLEKANDEDCRTELGHRL